MKQDKWKELTEKEIEYIKNNYHNTQTREIYELLNIPKNQLEFICSKYNLKKDKDFKVIRKDSSLTIEQCEYILKNYSNMSNNDICNNLGIKYDDLKRFANRRKLKKNKDANSQYKYTKEQIDYVKRNYSKKNNSIIAKELGLTESQVSYIAFQNNIKKDKDYTPKKIKGCVLTIKQRDFIKDNYSIMKTNDIARKLNLTYEQIHSYASNLKLKKDPMASKSYNGYWDMCKDKIKRNEYNVFNYLGHDIEPKIQNNLLYKSKYGKYKVNQNYFDDIDNEWKAYWLGFLYADGYNITDKKSGTKNINIFGLCLATIDRGHLQKFLDSLQSDSNINDYVGHLKGKEFYNSKVNICNQHICQKLKEKGCVPNKSLILKFPNNNILPNNLVRHFIRGYFDGDGCIHINQETKTISFGLVGTKEFLSEILDIFYNELNIDKKQICKKKNNNAYNISYSSITDIEKIYKYLYKDCNIYLERKLNKFNTLLCLD